MQNVSKPFCSQTQVVDDDDEHMVAAREEVRVSPSSPQCNTANDDGVTTQYR